MRIPKADPADAAQDPFPQRRFAPAKVNLALHVVGRRDDGYHLLDMLVAFADIGDHVSWKPGGDACRLRIEDRLIRPEPIPDSTDNLAWRALALAGQLGTTPLAGTLTVVKNLPSGAGIGGGSSDAAATLRAVLGDTAPDEEILRAAALALGADLPVCLAARPSRVEGVGERISSLSLAGPLPVVLVWPGSGLSTPEVFKARRHGDGAAIPGPVIDALECDPLTAISALRNDLEDPARRLLPAVGAALASLQACDGCRVARMSGSGSTVVGYFGDRPSADRAAVRLGASQPSWWVRAANLLA
ncbi:MAG: 4-(cytidine 5'-diphospho)-2-C-methyl-D-erythritol kinase [Thalassobaculaceae bacterium]|nr:4-(cytidine 5'-diphospho)-2-C-methyl-D-erythritol kinase [Thalassobaculaceae bacterium]